MADDELLGLEPMDELREQNARARAVADRNRENYYKAPFLAITPEAAWWNQTGLTHFLNGIAPGLATLVGADIKWYHVVDRTCCKVVDVVGALDSGAYGARFMGVLQIYRIVGPEQLSAWERRAIGFDVSFAGELHRAAHTSMQNRFDNSAQIVAGFAGNKARGKDWPDFILPHTWAAVAGDPHKGPVATLADTFPLEIGFSHYKPRVLYVRSLKYHNGWLKRHAEYVTAQAEKRIAAEQRKAEKAHQAAGLTDADVEAKARYDRAQARKRSGAA